MRHDTISGTTNFFSTVLAASTAGASACAGGVCAVTAQAVSAWSATASTAATVGSFAGTGFSQSYPWWHGVSPVHHPDTLSSLTRAALLLLWLSLAYTIISLAPRSRLYASLAAFGGLVITVAELHWIPGGSPLLFFALSIGLPLLLLAPWLPRWSPRRCMAKAIRLLLFLLPPMAVSVAIFTQYAYHWDPCPLCLVERAAFLLVSLLVLWRKPTLTFFAALFAAIPVALQMIEFAGHSSAAHLIAGACSAVGPSCATAGAKVLVFPMTYDAAVLSAVLLLLSLLFASASWNRPRQRNI